MSIFPDPVQDRAALNLRSPQVRAGGALLIVLLTTWACWPGLGGAPSQSFVLPAEETKTENEASRYDSALIGAVDPPRVHAASIAALPDGRLFAAWFGGTREGATDVKLYAAFRAPGEAGWEPQQVIASPEQTSRDTGTFVRKLGNPVAFLTPRGELWVIYVSVTLGGWASSHLNLLRSPDLGKSWLPARRLVVSPFFNLSTLAKGAPVFFENGDIGVPVYHELAGKFAELLVLAPTGEVRRKVRMSHGRRSLQPVILVQDERHAVALMRTAAGKRAWQSKTGDGGLHWSALRKTGLANPNSALSAVRLGDGRLLAVANDTEKDRLRLSLLVSADDGLHWRVLHRFEDRQASSGQSVSPATVRATLERDLDALWHFSGAPKAIVDLAGRNLCRPDGSEEDDGPAGCDWQYDYPYLIRDTKGDFHLVYTWNRSFIRYVGFNAAWLREREK